LRESSSVQGNTFSVVNSNSIFNAEDEFFATVLVMIKTEVIPWRPSSKLLFNQTLSKQNEGSFKRKKRENSHADYLHSCKEHSRTQLQCPPHCPNRYYSAILEVDQEVTKNHLPLEDDLIQDNECHSEEIFDDFGFKCNDTVASPTLCSQNGSSTGIRKRKAKTSMELSVAAHPVLVYNSSQDLISLEHSAQKKKMIRQGTHKELQNSSRGSAACEDHRKTNQRCPVDCPFRENNQTTKKLKKQQQQNRLAFQSERALRKAKREAELYQRPFSGFFELGFQDDGDCSNSPSNPPSPKSTEHPIVSTIPSSKIGRKRGRRWIRFACERHRREHAKCPDNCPMRKDEFTAEIRTESDEQDNMDVTTDEHFQQINY